MIVRLLSLAWLAGTIGAAFGLAGFWPAVLVASGVVSLAGVWSRKPRVASTAVFIGLVVLAAMIRYDASQPAEGVVGNETLFELNDGKPVSLIGTVREQPEERETSQRFQLAVEAVRSEDGIWEPAEGVVLVTARLFPEFRYGDRLQLNGRLATPPDLPGFDYREYLARKGIVSLSSYASIQRLESGGGSDVLRRINSTRSSLASSLERSMPEPEAALAKGILLGLRSSIPRDLSDDFNRSGISHLVAISGYNVMLIAGFSVASLAWLIGRRWAIGCSIFLIVFYAVLVGASPSVLRATIMAIVVLSASLAGRPRESLNALILTAAVLTFWQPQIVHDVAFQLSFAATLSIILLARPLQEILEFQMRRLMPEAPAHLLSEHLAVTIAASLAVMPIIASAFDRISPIALATNLLIVPVFPVVLGASGLTALAGVLDSGLGRLVGEVAYLPLAYMVEVGRLGAMLPGAAVPVTGLGSKEALLAYVGIFGVGVAFLRLRRPVAEPLGGARLAAVPVATLGIAILAVAVWWSALEPDDSRLRVTILEVGQGDAILLETPAGHRILVDGGRSGSRLLQELGEVLPANDRRIDVVLLTHPQDDHLIGLISVVERFKVGQAISGSMEGETAAYVAWRDALEQMNVPLIISSAGQRADLGGGVYLEVLGPSEKGVSGGADVVNENSLILRLVYGQISFLLTGDVAQAGEEALLNSLGDLHATVLKVAHHGSDGSSSREFIAAVDPYIAVISVGAGNPFGHPSPTTRLRLAGVPVLRTDKNGRVEFSTDGANLWLRVGTGEAELVSRTSAVK